jgi:hypothetical protein
MTLAHHVYYLEVFKRLREKLDRDDPNFLPTTHGPCITTMHLLTRHSVGEFLASKQMTMLELPPYLPDLTLDEFFLFPKIRKY